MSALMQSTRYAFGVTVPLPFDQTVAHVRAALAVEGFGILTEADVAATLRARLGVVVKPYLILGACNPPLAHRALQAEPEIGTLLPCNVVCYEGASPGETIVQAMDPAAALALSDNPALEPVAAEVRQRIERALDAVQRGVRSS